MTPLTRLSVVLVAVSMLGSACAFTTAQVDLGYAPEAGEKSPLGTLKPMMVLLQVEDQREAAERDQVGNKRNGFGTITAPVKSNKDVLGIVAEALKNEFQSGGHNVSTQDSGTTEVIVRVALKRYWSDMTIKFFEIEMLGTMNAKVAIERPREPREVGAKDINSTFSESRQIAGDGAFESVLNGVLKEFVRNFGRDPVILNALQSIEKEKT